MLLLDSSSLISGILPQQKSVNMSKGENNITPLPTMFMQSIAFMRGIMSAGKHN